VLKNGDRLISKLQFFVDEEAEFLTGDEKRSFSRRMRKLKSRGFGSGENHTRNAHGDRIRFRRRVGFPGTARLPPPAKSHSGGLVGVEFQSQLSVRGTDFVGMSL
jgi:hypothetical protein